ERFEYEMNMLIECKQHEIMIQEVPIETIYLEDNKSSHFNPLLDSLKIYSVFLKFIFSSLSSFIIDISLYTMFIYMLKDIIPMHYILTATIVARIISSVFNFYINRTTVFKSKENQSNTLFKYYFLCFIQMMISGYGVAILYQNSGLNEITLKLIVDAILFLLSFQIQREWVFAPQKKRGK
ncbi:MAG: GtrA family protein, partial [Turicibacter sp.]